MSLIAQMRAITGRWLKEDDTTVNVADAFDNSDPSNPKLRALLSGRSTASAVSKDVAAAATPEALGSGAFYGVVIAKSTNTATAYIGDSSNQYAPLAAGEERQLETSDLSVWYGKVGVDGEGFYLVGAD